MKNYSRKFRRSRGGNPFAGLLGSSDPNKKVQDAQAELDKAKEELRQSQANPVAPSSAPSSGFKLPFTGGEPANDLQKATNSVTSGVSAGVNTLNSGVNSGVKALGSGVNSLTSMLPKMNGGRQNKKQTRRQNKKNKSRRR
jgi:hypothetical protein